MSKKSATQRRLNQVRSAFRPEDLIRICTQQDFSDYAHRVDLPSSRSWRGEETQEFFYYRDNGASVLAVAHLDHVQEDGTCTIVDTADGQLALSGALDDRLGVYVILELLPRLGITVDWLLTTNEEMGASTARNFMIDKQYNWMIEFDRSGTDVVMYQYETEEAYDLVRAAGAQVGTGSYSDIAELDGLGCVGFNWGVGYYDYHSKRSHAWLEDTFKMVGKFMRFFAANASTHLVYEDEQYGPSRWSHDGDDCPRCNQNLYGFADCNNCGWEDDGIEDACTLDPSKVEQSRLEFPGGTSAAI